MKTAEAPPELLIFIKLFNREKYFEAHEILESRWRKEKGEARDFYQGLIQIAAAFVHLKRGTPEGAQRLLETATKYFKPYGPFYGGVNLEGLLTQTRSCLLAKSQFPRISLSGSGIHHA